MSTSLYYYYYGSGSRLRTMSVCVGALALMFYVTSFYTRDWRSLVPPAAQRAAEPAPARAAPRSIEAPRSVEAKLANSVARIDIETTGTVTKAAEPAARPPAAETPRVQLQAVQSQAAAGQDQRAESVAGKTPRMQAQPATAQSTALRPVVRHRANKQTQVAALRAPSAPSRREGSASPAMPIQFQLAERGN